MSIEYCCSSFQRARKDWQIYVVKGFGIEPYYEVRDSEMYSIFEIEFCPFCGSRLLGAAEDSNSFD
jgi:hypothetical protein